jgi:hypothetical protein
MQWEQWTKKEKEVCRRAFNLALDRECRALTEEVRRKASKIADVDDVWRLDDFISERREEIAEKYDYRYSVLIFVFARLMRDGWVTEEELEGLSDDKMTKILFMAGKRDA